MTMTLRDYNVKIAQLTEQIRNGGPVHLAIERRDLMLEKNKAFPPLTSAQEAERAAQLKKDLERSQHNTNEKNYHDYQVRCWEKYGPSYPYPWELRVDKDGYLRSVFINGVPESEYKK